MGNTPGLRIKTDPASAFAFSDADSGLTIIVTSHSIDAYQTGEKQWSKEVKPPKIMAAEHLSDAGLLVTAHRGGGLRLHKASDGSPVKELRVDGLSDEVKCLVYGPPDCFFAAGAGSTITQFCTRTHNVIREFSIPNNVGRASVLSLACDIPSDNLFVGFQNGKICQYVVSSGNQTQQLGTSVGGGVHAMAYIPSWAFLCFATTSHHLRVWNVQTGWESEIDKIACTTLLFDEASHILFCGTENSKLVLWKPHSTDAGKRGLAPMKTETLFQNGKVKTLWYHPDADVLVAVSTNGALIKARLGLHTYMSKSEGNNSTTKDLSYLEKLESVLQDIKTEDCYLPATEFSKFKQATSFCDVVLPLLENEDFYSTHFADVKKGIKEAEQELIQKEKDAVQKVGQVKKDLSTKYAGYIDPDYGRSLMGRSYEKQKTALYEKFQNDLNDLEERYKHNISSFESMLPQVRDHIHSTYADFMNRMNLSIATAEEQVVSKSYNLLFDCFVVPVNALSNNERYRIVCPVQGSSKVYKGIDVQFNRAVAVKELAVRHLPLIQHTHPCILDTYDMVVPDRCPSSFAVTQLMLMNLQQCITKLPQPQTLPMPQVATVIYKIAHALHYLHDECAHGTIVHRDISPSSIMLDSERHPKISCIGLMKTMSCDEPCEWPSDTVYASPEVVCCAIVPKSDIWSLGVVMAVLCMDSNARSKPFLTGKTPFDILRCMAQVVGQPEEDTIKEMFGYCSFGTREDVERVPQLQDVLKFFRNLHRPLPPFETITTVSRVVPLGGVHGMGALPEVRQVTHRPGPLGSYIQGAPKSAQDLVKKMLSFSPLHRPAAAEVLNHPFFDEYLPVEVRAELPPPAIDPSCVMSPTSLKETIPMRPSSPTPPCAEGEGEINAHEEDDNDVPVYE